MKDTGERDNQHQDPLRLSALTMGRREDGGRMQGYGETSRGIVPAQVAAPQSKGTSNTAGSKGEWPPHVNQGHLLHPFFLSHLDKLVQQHA